jgi:hypothetical protein
VGELTVTDSEGNDFGSLIDELEGASVTFRENAGRYAFVFTAESLDGDEINADPMWKAMLML